MQRKQEETEYRFAELWGNGIRGLIAMELLLHGVFLLLGSEFPEWQIGWSYYTRIQFVLIPVLVYFEILAVMKRRVRKIGKITAGIVIPAGFGLWALSGLQALFCGYHVVYNDYIKYWNSYYKTNYGLYETEGSEGFFFLEFLILSLFVLCMLFRYLTEIRLFMILPGVLVLSLGLLVNALPDWSGLAEFFVGVLILYSASWGKGKVIFYPCPETKSSEGRRFFFQSLAAVVVVLLGALIVVWVPKLLGGKAEKIPVHAQPYIEFQQQSEERLAGLSGQIFSRDQAAVDNRTPKYTGKKILEICASERPSSNLYLKDFCSGVYVKGTWEETENFVKEAKDAGFTPEHLGSMLHQQYFEQKQTFVQSEEGDTSPVLDYTINYTGKRTGLALVPYFSDLSDNTDIAWIEDDGAVRKKKSAKTLNFKGLSQNTFFTGDLQESYHPAEKNDAVKWYGDFVMRRNLGGSKEIPALNQYVREIEETYGITRITDVDPDYETNFNRLTTAAVVRSILSEKASYNLYLDSIPAGTDTIQYFLETGHEGYCMHFASAGVLLLQELGVPARYASGYIVKASSFYREDGQFTAEVADRNAHAWAEIYLENYGWVPYEMTPGYQDVMSSLPTDEEHRDYLKRQHERKVSETQQMSEKPILETQNSEPEESQPQVSETSEAGTETSEIPTGAGSGIKGKSGIESGRLAVVTGLFLMILFCGGLLIWHLKKEQETLSREIHGRQYRSALIRMNRRIYRRLWNRGPEVLHLPAKKGAGSRMHLSYLTDEEFLQKLMQTYPAVSPEDWKHYMEIVQKAAFSQEEITREEMRFCYSIYQRYRGKR